jgi:hypothetical protein
VRLNRSLIVSFSNAYIPTAQEQVDQPVQSEDVRFTPAEQEFHTSSRFQVPAGYEKWLIRNDYPSGWTQQMWDAPWTDLPLDDPTTFMQVMKEYCFEGMVENNFIPQNNHVRHLSYSHPLSLTVLLLPYKQARPWYHAPWMHYGDAGREPLHGLTSERYTPPRELSATQQRTTQTWAVGFYNAAGESIRSCSSFGLIPIDDRRNCIWRNVERSE